jgi:hypothetical protein
MVDRGLWIVDCGLWIVDCGLWMKAEKRNRQGRQGRQGRIELWIMNYEFWIMNGEDGGREARILDYEWKSFKTWRSWRPGG